MEGISCKVVSTLPVEVIKKHLDILLGWGL